MWYLEQKMQKSSQVGFDNVDVFKSIIAQYLKAEIC